MFRIALPGYEVKRIIACAQFVSGFGRTCQEAIQLVKTFSRQAPATGLVEQQGRFLQQDCRAIRPGTEMDRTRAIVA